MGYNLEVKIDNTNLYLARMGDAVEKALEEIGLTAESYAKMACPVDTGRLRNSITHKVDMGDKTAVIGTNVEYAPYVEMGTSRWGNGPKGAPRDGYKFLTRAAQDHADTYRSILENNFKV